MVIKKVKKTLVTGRAGLQACETPRLLNNRLTRMVSSGMLRRVAVVRTYVSEELSSSIIRMTRIG
jgi:hypothetical protein